MRTDRRLRVLAGDHGEEFLDHGSLGHGMTLYEEIVRVPLIFRAPGSAGAPRTVDSPVSLVSLTPTLLDLLDLGGEGRDFQAGSFAALLDGEETVPAGPIFLEDNRDERKKAIIVGKFKLIRHDADGEMELYNLERDPHELENLVDDLPQTVRELLPQLEQATAFARSRGRMPDEYDIPADELEKLRSLGYIGR